MTVNGDIEFSDTILTTETAPQFLGGDLNKFKAYVLKNFVYPASLKNSGIKGRVIVEFNVDATGKVVDTVLTEEEKEQEAYDTHEALLSGFIAEALNKINDVPADVRRGIQDGEPFVISITGLAQFFKGNSYAFNPKANSSWRQSRSNHSKNVACILREAE